MSDLIAMLRNREAFVAQGPAYILRLGRQAADELESANARIAELESDKARLDWLDKNIFHREKDEYDARIWRDYTMWVTFAPNGVQGSARNIIDAALANKKEG